jgi:hypothetical protein
MANVIKLVLLGLCVCCLWSFAVGEDTGCNVVGVANKTEVVSCPLGKVGVTWSRNNVSIQTTENKYTVDSENGTLTIIKIGEAYVGNYNCTFNGASETVVVCSSPYARQYDKAKNVIEGDPFQVECSAWGYPQVSVTWYRGNLSVSADEDSRVSFKNGTVENSTLRIVNMKFEDGADYVCMVTNTVGVANATIKVNVKDKYAALWPFLGICIEVFVLCTIIFCYERRRTKKLAKEAQNDEAECMTANNDTRCAEDVRQRK